jgi:hypothetical protein
MPEAATGLNRWENQMPLMLPKKLIARKIFRLLWLWKMLQCCRENSGSLLNWEFLSRNRAWDSALFFLAQHSSSISCSSKLSMAFQLATRPSLFAPFPYPGIFSHATDQPRPTITHLHLSLA